MYGCNSGAWTQASDPTESGGCVTVRVDSSTHPSLANLTGTPFAVGAVAPGTLSGGVTVHGGGGVGLAPVVIGIQPAVGPAADIARLARRGVVTGFPDGTFRPEAAVTRAQFVKLLVLTLEDLPRGAGVAGSEPGWAATPFTEVAPGDWFAPCLHGGGGRGLRRRLSGRRLPAPRDHDPGAGGQGAGDGAAKGQAVAGRHPGSRPNRKARADRRRAGSAACARPGNVSHKRRELAYT